MTPEFAEHDALIVRSLMGTATPADQRILAVLRESPSFSRYYDATVELWALTSAEHARRSALTPVPEVVERQLRLRRSTGEHPVQRVPRSRRVLVAAALLVVALGGLTVQRGGLGIPFFASTTDAEYQTRGTETMTVTLGDGSVAHLAPRSRLRVVRSRRRHGLMLEGHAFFAVHRDSRSPLLVYTARGLVEVTRGRFDVQTSPRATRVLVVDGEVTIEAGGGRVSSVGGHALRATDSAVTADAVADIAPQLAWMRGFLVFRDTPLRTVAQEIEQLYGVKVQVADAVAGRTVTAWFAHQPFSDVLGVISRATYTAYSIHAGVARLEPASGAAIISPKRAVAN